MKRKLVLPIIIIVAASAIIIPQVVEEFSRRRTGATEQTGNDPSTTRAQGSRREEQGDGSDSNGDLPERDEQRQTFQLQPGARVEIANIGGKVDVETSDSNTAEVLVVRSARARADLERRRITIEGSPTSLVVRGEGGGGGSFGGLWSSGNGDVRQRVVLRLPRRIEFKAIDINGRARVGEIDGGVEIADINGRVEVAGVTGHVQIVEVNGRVNVGVERVADTGIQLSDINGNVELRFAGEVNADVDANDNHGAVEIFLPNVTMQERRNRSNFRARIGTGGAPITITDVNGRARLAPRINEN